MVSVKPVFIIHFTEGTFVFPDSARIPELTDKEAEVILSRNEINNARQTGKNFLWSFLAVAVSELWLRDPIISFVLCCICAALGLLALKFLLNYLLSLRLAAHPERVTWAYPNAFSRSRKAKPEEYQVCSATFRTESGGSRVVGMSYETIAAIFAWLRRRNPAVRLTGAPPPGVKPEEH